MRSTRRAFIFTALVLASMATGAHATDYFVLGRVYSALEQAAGDEAAANPLTGVPSGQILGDELAAAEPRNLVNVRVIDAATSAELGSYITRKEGGYLVTFAAPGGGISVRFVVEELATSRVLFESEANVLDEFPGINTRFLLVSEEPAEIGNDRDFAPAVSLPAKYTAIFTRVGKIELQTEDPPGSGTQVRLIDTTTGRATVGATVSSDLAIPQYQDAPWGGNLFLFGAFSHDLYTLATPDLCYSIRVDDLDAGTSFDFTDPLVKTKYTVDFTTGTVDTERVTLGPKNIGAAAHCYEFTELSPSNNVFWSFPDLLALWRTGTRSGRYRLTIHVENLPVPGDFAAISDFTDLVLGVDNTPIQARILPLEPSDPDSPRVYTPGPVPASADLTATRLGSYPVDYGGSSDPTCEIFNVQGMPTKYLAFKLTAHQPNGFLRSWHFSYQRNDGNDETVMGKRFDGSSMVDLGGVRVSSAETSTSGFQNMFVYLDPAHLQPAGPALGGCAYRFVVHAARRTTDGYHYLSSSWDQDLHYVQK